MDEEGSQNSYLIALIALQITFLAIFFTLAQNYFFEHENVKNVEIHR